MGGRHLREEGRSTSAELRRAHLQHSVIHFLPDLHNWGSVAIMPRSFYRYVVGTPETGKGHWDALPPADTKIELEVATKVAEAALEFDGKRLYRLWQRLGITCGGRHRDDIQLHLSRWVELRYNHVVVLWGAAADKLWSLSSSPMTICLCCCTPFALWAGCEHEKVMRDHADPSFNITTQGQNRGGRGNTNEVHYGLRGKSAKMHHRIAAGKAAKAKAVRRVAKNEKGSPLVPEHLPIWKYASGDLASRNDAQQSKKAKERQVTNSDALLVLLRKLKLQQFHAEFVQKGITLRALESGHMKADMLFPILGSFERACDVLAAATKNADGVSGSVASGLTAALQDTGACTATNPGFSSPISSSSSTSSHASQKH